MTRRVLMIFPLLVGLLVPFLTPALSSQGVIAATHCVNPGGSGGCFSTIQDAIDDYRTVDGDTIAVAANDLARPSYNEDVTVTKSISIIGAGRSTTTLDGTIEGGIVLAVNRGKTVHINGLTVRDGSAPGTHIVNDGSLTFSDSTIALDNIGAVVNYDGATLVFDATSLTGSVSNDVGTVTLANSSLNQFSVTNRSTGTVTITNCVSRYAYASNNDGGRIVITDSTLLGSFVTNNGGGDVTLTRFTLSDGIVYNNGVGTITVRNSDLSGNGHSPGISNGMGGGVTVRDSSIRNFNSGTGGTGGGIANLGAMTLMNATVSGNTARQGGGIYNAGTLILIDATVSNNSASDSGGGIVNTGTTNLINSTISGNDAADGGGVANNGVLKTSNTIIANNATSHIGPDVLGATMSGGHNLIGNTNGASGFVGSDLENIGAQLSSLTNHGGFTQTMALQSTSPAIGAGDAAICAASAPNGAGGVDQRGIPRAPGSCSIGAYEARPSLPGPLPPPKPTAPPSGSPTSMPIPRPTAVPVVVATPNPIPAHR